MKSVFYVGTLVLVVTSGTIAAKQRLPEITLGEPVQAEALDEARGQSGILDINNVANLQATLTGNTASNTVTGNNTIDAQSFTDASGVFSIIQNTGNNVIIQDSTIITVTVNPDL